MILKYYFLFSSIPHLGFSVLMPVILVHGLVFSIDCVARSRGEEGRRKCAVNREYEIVCLLKCCYAPSALRLSTHEPQGFLSFLLFYLFAIRELYINI